MTETVSQKAAIPVNLYKMTAPLAATVVSNTRLTPDESPNDVRHLVLRYPQDTYRFLEGQSAGITPPGLTEQGKPHILRLYSIACERLGEDGTGTSLALTVKRVVYTDEQGVERRGVASNYLCDLRPGEEVKLTGPTGRTFLLPDDPQIHLVMIATGTGVAPFRGFLRQRYQDPQAQTGLSWLIFGAQKTPDLLYRDELERFAHNPQVRLTYAISREQQTPDGRKMYVQERVREQAGELFRLLQDGRAVVYICGLKGMETGISEVMGAEAAKHGVDWASYQQELKKAHRWHVETY